MKLKTISYSESRETVDARGLKQWKKIGVEVETDGNEDFTFAYAKDLVESWHKKAASSNYFSEPETLPVINVNDR